MRRKISIYGSAARPQHWIALYNSIGENDVDFEIVFAGPHRPEFQLPDNFHFIKSATKPAQCSEIAFRNTTGSHVLPIADDCEFMTPRPLDSLYQCYTSYNNPLLIVSTRLMTNGEDHSGFAHRYYTHDPNSPVMPLCGLMSRDLHRDVGGIDRNFVAIMWDLDLALRVYALGGTVVLSDVYVNEDKKKRGGLRNLTPDYWNHDRALLDGLWTTNGKVHLNRTLPVQGFSDTNILDISQGPRGRWRGDGPAFIEAAENSFTRFRSTLRGIYRKMKRPDLYPTYARKLILRLKGK